MSPLIFAQKQERLPLVEILGYDPLSRRCAGYAPSQGRGCHNPVNIQNVDLACSLLESMQYMSKADATKQLSKLAYTTLCVRYHRNTQVQDKVTQWSKKLALWEPVMNAQVPEETVADLQAVRDELETERDMTNHLSKQVKILKKHRDIANDQIEDWSIKYEKNNAKKTQEITRLRESNAAAQSSSAQKLEIWTRNYKEKKDELQKVESANAGLKASLQERDQDLQEKYSKIYRLMESNKSLSEQKEASGKEIIILNHQLKEKDTALEKVDQELTLLRQQVNDSKAQDHQIHTLNHQLDEKDTALEKANREITLLHEQVTANKAQDAEVHHLTKQLAQQTQQSFAHISTLDLKIHRKTLVFHQLRDSLHDANAAIHTLQSESQQLRVRGLIDAFCTHVQILVKQKLYERTLNDNRGLEERLGRAEAAREREREGAPMAEVRKSRLASGVNKMLKPMRWSVERIPKRVEAAPSMGT